MPLPSKSECANYKDCYGKVVKIELAHDKELSVARAIAQSHCTKLFGKVSHEAIILLNDMREIVDEYEKKKKKWMQKAAARMKEKGTEGKTTAECKKMGYDGVTNECLRRLKARGGKWAQRAQYAINVRKK